MNIIIIVPVPMNVISEIKKIECIIILINKVNNKNPNMMLL
jgi:hypothetical protein